MQIHVFSFKRWKEASMVALLLLLSFIYGSLVDNAAIEAIAPSQRELPVYSVETDKKVVALTMDTANGQEAWPKIFEILDHYNVKATFFVTLDWAKKHADILKEAVKRGHEVGNHSATHPYMSKMSRDQIEKELMDTTNYLESVTGQRTMLFRPPYGDYSSQMVKTCRECGFQVIQWDVDSIDWQDPSVDVIVQRINKNVRNGSILLFHTNASQITESLPAVIESLKEKGYGFVKTSELVLYKDYTIDHTGRQFPLAKDEGIKNTPSE
ncbi:MAG: polysaccharide deacetylase family protein [Bacillota bacterium]